MDVDPLERLFLAIRDLRKADRKSKEWCAEMGKPDRPPSNWVKNGWTKAAIERDRCHNYARELAKEFFNFND